MNQALDQSEKLQIDFISGLKDPESQSWKMSSEQIKGLCGSNYNIIIAQLVSQIESELKSIVEADAQLLQNEAKTEEQIRQINQHLQEREKQLHRTIIDCFEKNNTSVKTLEQLEAQNSQSIDKATAMLRSQEPSLHAKVAPKLELSVKIAEQEATLRDIDDKILLAQSEIDNLKLNIQDSASEQAESQQKELETMAEKLQACNASALKEVYALKIRNGDEVFSKGMKLLDKLLQANKTISQLTSKLLLGHKCIEYQKFESLLRTTRLIVSDLEFLSQIQGQFAFIRSGDLSLLSNMIAQIQSHPKSLAADDAERLSTKYQDIQKIQSLNQSQVKEQISAITHLTDVIAQQGAKIEQASQALAIFQTQPAFQHFCQAFLQEQ